MADADLLLMHLIGDRLGKTLAEVGEMDAAEAKSWVAYWSWMADRRR